MSVGRHQMFVDGNETRLSRVAILRRMHDAVSRAEARDMCARLLEDPPASLRGMDVHELLERCPGIGLSRADRYQTAVGLFYAVRVGEMDDQIRAALVRELRRTSGDGAHLRIGPMVDAEPFCRWLASRLLPAQRGFTDRARRIGINGSHASRILCGQIAKVRLEIVERVLMEEGSTALWELYGELYDEEVAA